MNSTYMTVSFSAAFLSFLIVVLTERTSSVSKATSSARFKIDALTESRSGILSSATTFSSFLMATVSFLSADLNFGDFRKTRPKKVLKLTFLQNLVTSIELQ